MDVDRLRDLFPITRTRIFMNHAGVAAWSTPVRRAVDDVGRTMAEQGWDAERYNDDVARLRGAAALLFGGRREEIAIGRGTSSLISVVAGGLDWKPGDNVVTARLEYPANLYPWLALADRGIETRLVEPEDGRVTPEAIFAQVDGRTRVVAISWVAFWNGFRADLESIGEECRRRGVIFCVDAIQGLGALRFPAGCCDFAAAGGGKWLLGMPGCSVGWFSAKLIDRLRPALVGTHSVQDPVNYFNPRLEWATTAHKFEEAVTSWPNVAGERAALELLVEEGLEEIEPRVLELSERLREVLSSAGCELVEPARRRDGGESGIVSFRVPGRSNEEVLARLSEAGVVCRNHSDFTRLSPTFYNTEAEIDAAAEALRG